MIQYASFSPTSMYEKREDIVTPPDDAIIWRYMNLEKLLALLATNRLFLSRLDRVRDPGEGVWPDSVVNELKQGLKPEQLTVFLGSSEGLKTSMFVSCWHEAAHESAALWSQYAAGAGHAMKSSIGRVKRAISGGPNYHIGRVNYLDFKNDAYRLPDVNALILPFLKRKSFEHEREVRILVWDPDKVGPPDPGTSFPDGIELPVRLDDLIDALYISPEAPTWLSEHAVELLRRFGLPNLPVIQSNLYDKHVY
jgi:hypothetical protein